MSRFEIDLEKAEEKTSGIESPPFLDGQTRLDKPSFFLKFIKIFAVLVFILAVGFAVGGFIYWQYLKTTPQYSLALLVEAARQNDQEKIAKLVDTDQVVDGFLPQIIDEAVELYGRGLPPRVLKKAARVAAPLVPAVKERARAELPGLIRQKTERFKDIPFWALAVGADRYLEIRQNGQTAYINSRYRNRPLEIVMKKNGEFWQVVGVRDELLARSIAEKIGREFMEVAKQKSREELENVGRELGIENMQKIFEDFTDIFKK